MTMELLVVVWLSGNVLSQSYTMSGPGKYCGWVNNLSMYVNSAFHLFRVGKSSTSLLGSRVASHSQLEGH